MSNHETNFVTFLQPRKKSVKDSGSPVVKTITNYFSPVPKPAEKPFSPPRSNNIMDYFNRKASLSKEKKRSPQQKNPNTETSQLAERNAARETNAQPQKRRKTSRAARKLVESETVTSEERGQNKEEQLVCPNSAETPESSCGILGSDTAALLVLISAEARLSAGISERKNTEGLSLEQNERDENSEDPKQNKHVKPEIKCTEFKSNLTPKDKSKQSRATARSFRKVQQPKGKDAEVKEGKEEASACDVGTEVVDDSQINSTVTISYEDFLQSHEKVREDVTNVEENTEITSEEEMDAMEISKAEEKAASADPSLQVSPRTVTIRAEVHAVSHKRDTAKVDAKLASIFNRRKGTTSSSVFTSTQSHTDAQIQLPASSPAVKRKSNVVLQEEDLELAVLDGESASKCSEVERKQFMAAFKQPSLDGPKTKTSKSQIKLKQGGENASDQVEKVPGKVLVSVDQEPDASPENKAVKKKPARKDELRDDEEKEAQPVSRPDPDSTSEKVLVNDKESPVTSASCPPALRPSRKAAAFRKAPESRPTTPFRKSRKSNESKDDVDPGPSPASVCSSKRRRFKHGVFVAEIMSLPSTKQSPIR